MSIVLFNTIICVSLCSSQQNFEITSRFSVSFHNKELNQVFYELTEITGYNISLMNGPSITHKVSGNFENVDIFECLNKILKNESRAISIDEQAKQISIYMPKISGNRPSSGFAHHRTAINADDSGDTELILPETPNKTDTTLSGYQQYQENNAMKNQLGDELIPPDDTDEEGMTVLEYQQLMKEDELEDPSEDELIPPDDTDEEGMTVIEYQQLMKTNPSNDLSNDELIPDDDQ